MQIKKKIDTFSKNKGLKERKTKNCLSFFFEMLFFVVFFLSIFFFKKDDIF